MICWLAGQGLVQDYWSRIQINDSMAKISDKVLYAIVGTGIAGSVSTGLYFGLGNSLATNSASEQLGGAVESSRTQMIVSYGGGKQCSMENISGDTLSEEVMKKLREELTDEVCQQSQ